MIFENSDIRRLFQYKRNNQYDRISKIFLSGVLNSLPCLLVPLLMGNLIVYTERLFSGDYTGSIKSRIFVYALIMSLSFFSSYFSKKLVGEVEDISWIFSIVVSFLICLKLSVLVSVVSYVLLTLFLIINRFLRMYEREEEKYRRSLKDIFNFAISNSEFIRRNGGIGHEVHRFEKINRSDMVYSKRTMFFNSLYEMMDVFSVSIILGLVGGIVFFASTRMKLEIGYGISIMMYSILTYSLIKKNIILN